MPHGQQNLHFGKHPMNVLAYEFILIMDVLGARIPVSRFMKSLNRCILSFLQAAHSLLWVLSWSWMDGLSCDTNHVDNHDIAKYVRFRITNRVVRVTKLYSHELSIYPLFFSLYSPIRLEANHVIDKSQVWITSVPTGYVLTLFFPL